MKISRVVLIVSLSVAATLATLHYNGSLSPQVSPAKETAYARIMRTGTIRCGYLIYPSFVERDPNTNVFSGMWVDLTEEIGKQLNLKIEWTEEVGTTNAFDGLKTGRYDVVCVPFTQSPSRSRETAFTMPVLFTPYYVYVRPDDTRFDNAYDKINDPSVRYAYLEGELAQTIRAERFPKSQPVSLPNLTDISQVLLNVAMGKADVVTTEPSTAEIFLLNNPGKLRRAAGPSLEMDPTGFNVAVGEQDLLNMLNTTLRYLLTSGKIEKIVSTHTKNPDQFFLSAQPWGASSVPQSQHP